MKSIKIAMAALVVTVGLVASFAFTNKSMHKPTLSLYLFSGAHDAISQLRSSEIQSATNWAVGTATFGTSTNLAAIDFEMETTTDGGNDGQLTVQEAIDALWGYYDNVNKVFPSYSFTVATGSGSTPATVNIYRKQ
jgi:hypothetical protein